MGGRGVSTERIIDDTRAMRNRTAIGAFFIGTDEEPLSPDTKAFLPASERSSARELTRVAAFAGWWLFVAIGCCLPWGGSEGWWIAARIASCIALWPLAWLMFFQLSILVLSTAALVLEKARVLSRGEARMLIDGGVIVVYSILALALLAHECVVCRVVGGVWLLALMVEGMLRGVLFIKKLLSRRHSRRL